MDLFFFPAMLFFNTYLVLYKYKEPKYIYSFLLVNSLFFGQWQNKEKLLWLIIFFAISITMILMENLMIYLNGNEAISYKYKYYLNIPYWLPMVYWNIVFFIAFLYYNLQNILV